MRYPVEQTAAKHERIVKEASPRIAAVTWTPSRVIGNLKSTWAVGELTKSC
jgi:hypothetical protein